jgi:hypothetical protein
MKDSDILIDTIRKNIVDTLVLLSSHEKQSEYPVPVEWLCFWFDDYYHPKDKSFKQAFTAQELEALSEFNVYFEAETEQIGDPPTRPDELWNMPAWQGIMKKAIETLKIIKMNSYPNL